jgi:bacteriorhodopsin
MKPFWDQIREDIRRNTRNLFLFWAIGALAVLIVFAVLWASSGSSLGMGSAAKAIFLMIVIAIFLPPLVWLIGKLTI